LGDHSSAGKTETRKGHIMKTLFVLICVATLSVAYAQTQTNTSSSTTSSNPSTSSMTSDSSNTTAMSSTTNNSGMVTDCTPGAAITLDPGTGKPMHFIIGDKVQVVGPDGKVIANTDLKKNARVRLHLVQEGDRTVVDQINVEDVR
jgi:ABC-type transport system substrate-binding protein